MCFFSHPNGFSLIIFVKAKKNLLNIGGEHIASVNDIDIGLDYALGLFPESMFAAFITAR